MKKKIFYFVALLGIMSGCHKPEIPVAKDADQGLNSVSAQFATGEYKNDANAKFTVQVTNPDQEEILIPIPWNYPEETDNNTEITNMRITANLDDNVSVDPPLSSMDLTKKNYITVTKADGTKKGYYITGERRKSSKCAISSFVLANPLIVGVIDEDAKTISLISVDDLGMSTAEVSISSHATISPDPSVARSYANDVTFTVTAQDGTTEATYTVQKTVPPKINYGFRTGSATELWANDFNLKYGITNGAGKNFTLAAMGTNLILSDGTQQFYFNSATGEKIGNIAGSMSLSGGAITSDKAGNMLLCNIAAKNATFNIYKTSSVTETPTLFISMTYNIGVGVKMGAKINVQGDINGNAIISVPTWAWAATPSHHEFIRWVVTNGVPGPAEVVSPTNIVNWNSGNSDVQYASASTAGRYFVTSYSGIGNKLDAVDGATNTGVARLGTATWGANSNFNAVDAVEFNKATYVAVYGGMHFTYSQCVGYMYDVTTLDQFTGLINNAPSLVFNTNDYRFGSPVLASSDILLIPSPDGYKLRLYYTDGNCRSLVAWEFDCIDK
ncbi:MAG: DUF5018 domain-containing protein [Bacteroidales bacterium]|nr:DUF5018 domain-containing protein [Bacteroidales bacterium]